MQQTSLTRFAWLSIAAALATIALKAVAYYITGSVGLLSDALESVVNLVTPIPGSGITLDSAEKPSVHPSRASGRTEEPLKSLEIFPFMLSLSKHS
jgi:hypothetical protein